MGSFFLMIVLSAAALSAETYKIQPGAGNRVALEVHKTGLMSGKKHLFEFARYHGSVDYDAKAPEKSKVELVLEAASIVLKDEWLDAKDFKKVSEFPVKDMLDTARYPQVRFSSTGVARQPDGSFQVRGNLTIRNVAKPVLIAVRVADSAGTVTIQGSSVVRMKEFGLKPPSALLGAIGTKDEMDVLFQVTLAQ